MSLVRSGALEGYEKQVKRLGGNPGHLLSQVGLSPALLRNPNTYISYSKMIELLEVSARACAEPCLGLLMSQQQTSAILGDLNMTVFRQPTVGDAMATVSRHLYLHARGARLQQEPQGDNTLLALSIDINSPLGMDQTMQLSVGQLGNFMRELLGSADSGCKELLRQPAPAAGQSRVSAQRLSRIEFGARADGVRFPSHWLQAQPRFDEERISEHLNSYLGALQQRYPDNLRDQVKDIIGQLLSSGECSLEQVASTLNLQPRVLQQRLQASGTHYGELLRETRQDIAEQHLRHGSLSVTELALQLGFAEASVFSRSFKSWTGQSPRAWQRQHGTQSP